MTTQSPTLVRCERCRAVISSAEAAAMIRHAVPCGVCGGTLALADARVTATDPNDTRVSPERRLLSVLRQAEGQPVGPNALAEAGIDDPASAIYELELAGHRIERAYSDNAAGRRLLGYRLRVTRRIR